MYISYDPGEKNWYATTDPIVDPEALSDLECAVAISSEKKVTMDRRTGILTTV